jgi:hypothetical protein
MRMQPCTKYLCSLLLTSAVIPFSGSSFAATSVARPAPAIPLTPEVLGKLLGLMVDKGLDNDVPPFIANALGLTGSGQTWPGRSLTAIDKEGTVRGFYVSRGADQDLLISYAPTHKIGRAYRARRDGTVIAAFMFDPDTRQLTMLDPAEAQTSLDAELTIWRGIAASIK